MGVEVLPNAEVALMGSMRLVKEIQDAQAELDRVNFWLGMEEDAVAQQKKALDPLRVAHKPFTQFDVEKLTEPDLLQEISNATAMLIHVTSSLEHEGAIEAEDVGCGAAATKKTEVQRLLTDLVDVQAHLRRIHAEVYPLLLDKGLYCICQQPQHNHRPMIQCDICGMWIHMTCVNISAQELSRITSYTCPHCSCDNGIFGLVQAYTRLATNATDAPIPATIPELESKIAETESAIASVALQLESLSQPSPNK